MYRKKILICSLNIILNLFTKINNDKLVEKVFKFLYLSVYCIFRIIFRINKKNNSEMFSLNDDIANQMAISEMIKYDCAANSIAKSISDTNNSLKLDNQTLENNWPLNYNALLNLIKNCENDMNKKI